MIRREHLVWMELGPRMLSWSAGDLEGLRELLEYWSSLFDDLDRLDPGDVGPFRVSEAL
jgi:hypothetical protein